MNKPKVCFIAQFPPPIHGLSKAVDTLYNSQLKEECDFEKVDITNNKLFVFNLIKIIKSKASLFYFTISQSKGGNIRDLIILKLISLRHKKCVIHLHGGYYRDLVDNKLAKWQKNANYKAIRKLEGVIVLGQSLKHIFEGMIEDKKIFVVPNCVDDEYLLTEKDLKNKIENVNKKTFKDVLYLSNFIKDKGYEYVLELAKIEKQEYEKTNIKNFHFHFAGKFFTDNEKQEFFDSINKNKLNQFVTYHGVVTGDEKRTLLKKSDIFVLLTTYPKEGQPISILEAMGNGMAVVTTNHAGIPDLVENESNGLVIDKKHININDIYIKIKNMDEKKIFSNNYESAKKYSQANYIYNMKKIFDNLNKNYIIFNNYNIIELDCGFDENIKKDI